MSKEAWLWLLGGAGLVALVYLTRQQSAAAIATGVDDVQTGVEDVTAAVAGWKNVKDGPTWVPVLNAAEQQYGIPTDLLARIAYQESHFRPEIIDGSKASSAGALGLMQLIPGANSKGVEYYPSVNVPRPFTADDTRAQIQEAAQFLASLMNRYNDWALAVAAYNDGPKNIDQYVAGTRPLPPETSSYVADVLADVPVSSGNIPA